LEEFLSKQEIKDLYIKTSLDNSRYLLSLSNDLLDMAMMKAGKFCIKDEPFNLKELIANIIEMF
jgi:signal transduction histidine kinase